MKPKTKKIVFVLSVVLGASLTIYFATTKKGQSTIGFPDDFYEEFIERDGQPETDPNEKPKQYIPPPW